MTSPIEMGGVSTETPKEPRWRLAITRHAERLPSGELSPEGIEHAKLKGEIMSEAELLKAYASDHSSDRAFQTGDLISKESGIKSPVTNEQYPTNRVEDIQYDILKPDLYGVIAKLKLLIEEPTLEEAFLIPELKSLIDKSVAENRERVVSKKDRQGNPMIDIEKLPVDVQMKIAPIRQKNQQIAFTAFLNNHPEATHRLAFGLAHQLVKELGIAERYSRMREYKAAPPKKDIVFNTVTHGLFMESLLKDAGIIVKPNGEEIHGIKDFQSEDFGGYIQPAESIYLDIGDPGNVPDRISVMFEGSKRPSEGKIFIDKQKLEDLNQDYLGWKESSAK